VKFGAPDHLFDGPAEGLVKQVLQDLGKQLAAWPGPEHRRGVDEQAPSRFIQERLWKNAAKDGKGKGLHGIGHHLNVAEGNQDAEGFLRQVGGQGIQGRDRTALHDIDPSLFHAKLDILRRAEMFFDALAHLRQAQT